MIRVLLMTCTFALGSSQLHAKQWYCEPKPASMLVDGDYRRISCGVRVVLHLEGEESPKSVTEISATTSSSSLSKDEDDFLHLLEHDVTFKILGATYIVDSREQTDRATWGVIFESSSPKTGDENLQSKGVLLCHD